MIQKNFKDFLAIVLMFTMLVTIKCQEGTLAGTASPVESPAFIKVPDCFYDSVENILIRLKENIEKYAVLLNSDSDPNIQKIVNIGSAVSKLEVYTKATAAPADVILTVKSLSANEDKKWSFAEKALDMANAMVEIPSRGEAYSANFWFALKNDWESVVQASDYNIFFKTNVWNMVLYQRQMEIIKFSFPDPKICFPLNFSYLTSFNDLAPLSAKDDYDQQRSDLKAGSNEFVIDPIYLLQGGVAITFWVNEKLQDIAVNKKLTVLEAFLGNTKVYELAFSRSPENEIINNFLINGETIALPSKSTCDDISFVIFSFEKELDHYKLRVIMKFLSTDSRYVLEREVPAHIVENVKFSFIKPWISNVIYMYKEFSYTRDRELLLMTVSFDQTRFAEFQSTADICSQSPPDCKYFIADGCLICKEGKLNWNFKCVDFCPRGTYQNGKNCDNCAVKCRSCTSAESDKCTDCFTPFVLYGTSCQTRCPDNMFPTESKCKECASNCVLCESATSCKICDPETYLLNGKCVQNCDAGYFKDINPNVCKPCRDSCKECSGIDQCSSCADNFFLLNEKCLRTCPENFFADKNSKKCVSCPQNCKQCEDEVICDTCVEGFYLQSNGKVCGTDCPKGTVSYKGSCVNCRDSNCESCEATNVAQCTSCNPNTFLKNGECVTNCGAGYYLDAESRTCLQCKTENCLACSKDKCFQCQPGLFVLEDTICLNNCPDGYIESGSICIKCKFPAECKKCSSSNTEVCTKCYSDKLLLEGKCVVSCPEGYFRNGENCEKCADGCKSCLNQFTCVDCQPNWFKKGNTCVTDCGSGFVSVNGVCELCTVLDCEKCDSTNVNMCQKCNPNFYLYANKCLSSCPISTFLTAQFTCEDCIKDCKQCENKTTCMKCISPNVLQGSVCQKTCDDGFVEIEGKCVPCLNSNCKKCEISRDTCSDCPTEKLLYQSDCIGTCPVGTFTKDRKCLDCVSPCKNCLSEKECTKCVENFALFGNSCTDNCPDGTAKKEDRCVACTSPECKKCNPDKVQECETCNDDFKLFNKNCYSECPTGYFALMNVCEPCLLGCKTCFDNVSCSVCDDGLFLFQNNQCVNSCPDGFFSDKKSGKCIRCKSTCKTCGEDVTQCTSCYENFLFYNGDCLTNCPDTTFKSDGKCLPCGVKDCGKCDDEFICRKCLPSKLLLENTCINAPCPAGYTQVGDTCQKCEVNNCKVCPETNTKVCSECTTGNFLYKDSTCESTCPINTFKNEGTGKCENCDSFCSYCTDEKHCSKCDTNYYLFENICVKQCPDQFTKVEDKCSKCSVADCKSCTNPNLCEKCMAPLKLFNNSCLPECPEKTYEYDGICYACPVFCKQCKDDNICSKCEAPKLLTTEYKCSDNCPDRTVAINGVCRKCLTEEKCRKCDIEDLTKCQECSGTLVLMDNKCISNCPDGFYDDQRTCRTCQDKCVKCSNGITCEQCEINLVLQDQKCQSSCNKGFYAFNGKCLPCEANCENCNSEKCFKCAPNLYLENGICKPQCSIGFFADMNMNCLPCGEDCISCKNESNCVNCIEGKFIKNGVCVSNCGSGYATVNNQCVLCESGCDVCDPWDLQKCLKCLDPFVLFNNDCKTACPPGTFKNSKSECNKCVDNCDVCSDAETCDRCVANFYLQPNKRSCKQTCDDGFRPESGVCVACSVKGCKKCSVSVDQCDECIIPLFFLDKSACVDKCPDGTFTNANKCDSCPSQCRTCQSLDICTSCITTFVLNDNKCESKCDPGEVAIRGECKKCDDPGCNVCDTTLTNCIECYTDKFLLPSGEDLTLKNICVNDCGIGKFALNGKCVDCLANCVKCNNERECNECASGTVLQDGKCQERCDIHYVERNGKCMRCENAQCQVCDNLTLKVCRRCDPGYVLKNNNCESECGFGFYNVLFDEIFSACKPCQANCKKCLDGLTCEECNNGFLIQEKKCVDSCSEGYVVKDNKSCVKCVDPNCHICDPYQPDVCISCNTPFVRQDNKCANGCLSGFFVDPNRVCMPCADSKCVNCSSETNCTNCASGYFQFARGCVPVCPEGYVADSLNNCVPCNDANCSRCASLEAKQCNVCKTGFFLNNGSCVAPCPTGTFPNAVKECQNCPFNCLSCSNESTCLSCATPYVLDSDKKCKDKCPEGKVDVGGICRSCEENCSKCDPTNIEKCLDCFSPLYLNTDDCVDKCPKGTFISGRECKVCNSNCLECLNLTQCLSCNPPLFLQDETCVQDCRVGFVGVKGKCIECADSNKTAKCDPTDIDISIECKPGFFLDNTKCVSDCGSGKYPNPSNKCADCGENCQQCIDNTQCTNCLIGFNLYNKVCIKECPNKTAAVSGVCKECTNPNCLNCNQSKLNECTACPEDKILYRGDCISSCPEKTFLSTEQKTCLPCNGKCQICQDATTCVKCSEGYLLNEAVCTSNCPDGKVPRNDICYPCGDVNCRICSSTDLNICLECSKGFLYKEACVTTCSEGFREDLVKKTCEKCPGNCSQCSETECNICKAGYFFAEGTKECVLCNEPDLVIGSSCFKCKQESCLKCVDSNPRECSVCQVNKVLVNGICVNNCPEKTYKRGQNCPACSSNCMECSDEKHCNKCDGTTVLFNNECISACPKGWISDNKGVCLKCSQNDCEKCQDNLTKCINCTPGTYKFKDVCYQNCPDKTYPSNENSCVECPETCAQCNASTCTECVPGFKLKGKDCVSECGEGYLDNGTTCTACADANCEQCTTLKNCEKCKKDFLLNGDGSCNTTCPDGFFADVEKRVCAGCQSGCLKCDINKCTLCAENLFLEDGKCVQLCSIGKTNVNGVCNNCNQSECLRCLPNDTSKCSECKPGNFRYRNNCIDKCPKGTYTSNEICVDCDQSCLDCDATQCLECKKEFVMNYGKCENGCPDGKVLYGDRCIKCANENCKTCLTDTTICISCKSPFKLVENSCKESCPEGYFQKEEEEKCEKCSEGCETCNGKSKCFKCENGYYLDNGVCLRSCNSGFYGDCSTRTCKPCDDSCIECFEASNQNCIKCNTGYFINDNSCVKPDNCEVGTYADAEKRECLTCKIPFCKECSSQSECKICQRGFQLSEKECVEAKTFINVIKPAQLFSKYTFANEKLRESFSFNEDLNGIAVSDTEISINFWIRKLKDSFPGTVIFATRSQSTPIQSLLMTTVKSLNEEYCLFQVTSSRTGKTSMLQTIDCSYKALYNWTYFSVTLSKNKDGTSILRVTVSHDSKLETFNVNIPAESSDLISKDTYLYFNEKNTGYDAFEISNFNVLDYFPTSNEISSYNNQTPDNCDYMCSDCRGVCMACVNGKVNEGYCPAGYIPIKPYITPLNAVVLFNIREKLTKRFVSDRYALALFFYITNIDETKTHNLASLYYQTMDSTSSPLNSVIDVSIVDKQIMLNNLIKFDNPIIKANTWYMFILGIKENYSVLYLREWNSDVTFKQELGFVNNIPRIFDDLTILIGDNYAKELTTVHIKGSHFNSRLYLNNLPTSQDVDDFFSTAELPLNCNSVSDDFSCLKCIDGYKLMADKSCVDSTIEQRTLLLDKVSIWRKDSLELLIPETLKRSKYAISFWLRKKKASTSAAPTSYNLISIMNPEKVKVPLITGVNQANYLTDLMCKFDGGDYFPISHNYSNEVHEFMNVILNVDNDSQVLQYSVLTRFGGEDKVYEKQGKWTNSFYSLVLGDAEGMEMNWEVAQVYYYQKLLNAVNVAKVRLEVPKDCDPACLDCSYSDGICKTCFLKTSVNVDSCPIFLKGFTSTYIFNISSYSALVNPEAYATNLNENFKKDVNSMKYSLIGYFKVFDWTKITSEQNGKFQIAQLSIFDNDMGMEKSPGKNLITLELIVKDGNAGLYWLIDDLDTPTYFPFTPQPNISTGDWILIFGGMTVQEKTFKYKYMINSAVSPVQTITLTNFPERLSERASLGVFGIKNKNKDQDYKIPNGHLAEFYYSINYDFTDKIWEAFRKVKSPPPTPVCSIGCSKCVVNSSKSNICLQCGDNYILANNVCKAVTLKKYGYMVINEDSDDLQNGVKYDLTKFNFSGNSRNYSISFYIRRNYFPDSSDKTTILTYGKMTVYTALNGNDFNLYAAFDGESNFLTLGPFDYDYSLDYRWYAVTLNFNTNLNKVNGYLSNVDKSVAKYQEITLVNLFSMDTSLTLMTPKNQVEILGAHIADNIMTFPLVDTPSKNTCDVDCDVCSNNVCTSCAYGTKSGNCYQTILKLPNKYISKATYGDNFYSISDYLGKIKKIKSRQFTLLFSFETSLDSSINQYRVLNFANSNQDQDIPTNINTFFSLSYVVDVRKFVIRLSNRSLGLKSEQAQYVFEYPLELKSTTHNVGIAVDGVKNVISLLFQNSKDNYIKTTISFDGLNDYMTLNTRIYLTNLFASKTISSKDYILYYDVKLKYSSADTDLTSLAASVSEQITSFQSVCSSSTREKCVSCPETILNGVCTESTKTGIFYLNKIMQVTFVNPLEASKFTSIPVNKFTFSFWWRSISYEVKPYEIAKISKSGANLVDYLRIIYDDNKLRIEGKLGTENQLEISNVYEAQDTYDWLHISVTYDIIPNNISAFIVNSRSGRTIQKTSNLNQLDNGMKNGIAKETKMVDQMYNLLIGSAEDDIPSGMGYSFEIASLIFTPNIVMDSEKTALFRIRKPKRCADPCMTSCNSFDVCEVKSRITSPLVISDETINSGVSKLATLNEMYQSRILSTAMGITEPNNSISYYLISFELNVGTFLNSPYAANKDVLLSITNYSADEIAELKMGDMIPENAFKFGAFAVQHRNGILRFYMGSNQASNLVNYYDVSFEMPLKSYNKLYVSALLDSKRKFAKLFIANDDLTTPYEMTFDIAPQLLFSSTFVYHHPALANVRLNVHNPRFDYDFERHFYTSDIYTTTTQNVSPQCNSANTPNCSKCFFNFFNNSVKCNKCIQGYKYLSEFCTKEINEKTTK